MSAKNEKNFDNQEIDLSIISDKFSGFLQSISRNIYLFIQFIFKNIFILGILFVLGVVLGFYLDKTQKTYKNSIIVQPNFESTDYLYSKIELLNTKIKDNDTLFLKAIGIQNPTKLMNVEVSPIIDVYKFISNSSTKESDPNFQLLKLMAEDGDIKTIIKENTTSKNYSYHKISFNTKAKISRKEVVEPLLDYLESNPHYSNIQKIYIDNIQKKIVANTAIVSQIDGILARFSNKNSETSGKEKLIYYNENTQVNDLVNTKIFLLNQNSDFRLNLQSLKKIIKEQSTIINSHNMKSINGKLKLILPVLFVLMYLFVVFFIKFYKKQSALYSKETL